MSELEMSCSASIRSETSFSGTDAELIRLDYTRSGGLTAFVPIFQLHLPRHRAAARLYELFELITLVEATCKDGCIRARAFCQDKHI